MTPAPAPRRPGIVPASLPATLRTAVSSPAELRRFAGRVRRGVRRRIYRPAPPLQTRLARARLERRASTSRETEYAALLAGAHADGDRGTVAFCVGAADRAVSRADVGAALGLARRLHEHGFGVVVLPPQRWSDLPRDTRAVVATTQTFDPALVPAACTAVAWMVDEPAAWPKHSALTLFDVLLPASPMLADKLRRRPDIGSDVGSDAGPHMAGPLIEVLPLAADVDPGRRSAAPRRWRRGLTVIPRGDAAGIALALRASTRRGPVLVLADPDRLTPRLRRVAVGARGPLGRQAANELAIGAVIDDPVGAAGGIVPAGVFEALAAGAMPITSSRLGLADLGLDGVASFRSGKELGKVLGALLGHRHVPQQLPALTARVLREHTYAARARAVVDLLERPEVHALPTRRETPRTVGFFPDFRVTNPYQDMLYAALPGRGVRVAPVRRPAERLVMRDGGDRLDGYTLHVHWTAAVVQVATDEDDAARRLAAFRQRVVDLRSRGGRLVWTVHNVLPHECRYPQAEVELCRFLAEQADLVHVMCTDTFAATRPHYTLDPSRTVVVPHSSYQGIYPDLVSRGEARRRLGLAADDVALLALGGIRPYRGLGALLDAVDQVLPSVPQLRLLVAGKPGDSPGVAELRERCERHPRVISSFAHVPDPQLQVWARSADVAVLPYRAILNSGAFKLAETFGLPVVAPRDGCVASAIDPAYAVGFDPADDGDLRKALAVAVALARDPESAASASTAALASAAAYPPAAMAADFADALDRLQGSATAGPFAGDVDGADEMQDRGAA